VHQVALVNSFEDKAANVVDPGAAEASGSRLGDRVGSERGVSGVDYLAEVGDD
jgi:hypothetical protein